MRWRDAASCSHANEEACKTRDFDRYYARTYPDCPWAVEQPLSASTGDKS